MSHELRTPLNSLLILAEMLADNPEGNLTAKQREFAQTIYAAGSDLLSLINDILDMAKIESGTMAIEVGELAVRRPARVRRADVPPGGRDQGPGAGRRRWTTACRRPIATDAKRLQQVLRNLLSNAFKFTEEGRVDLRIEPGRRAAGRADHPVLGRAGRVVAFVGRPTRASASRRTS